MKKTLKRHKISTEKYTSSENLNCLTFVKEDKVVIKSIFQNVMSRPTRVHW